MFLSCSALKIENSVGPKWQVITTIRGTFGGLARRKNEVESKIKETLSILGVQDMEHVAGDTKEISVTSEASMYEIDWRIEEPLTVKV